MIKTCIFDLDGTLTNSLPTIAHFINQTIKKYEIPEIPVNDFKLLVGNGTKKLVERVLQRYNKNDKELKETIIKEYTNSYDASPSHLCKPYRGIKELIKRLQEKNIKLAVVSNKQQIATEKVITTLFGEKTFAVILGARENHPLKPNPAGIYEILQKLDLRRDECLFIGDTYVDIETGKNASIKTIGVLWGFRDYEELKQAKADEIIKDPMEILNFIE